ncbi:MAG: gamma-glutamyltransferase family protein [Spirochaetaceae bacterium]
MVVSRDGMVAASHPLAAQIGRDILKRGGNAVDAAISTAAALTMVEPTSNGIGGDCFALVWKDGSLYSLNASGWAPSALAPDHPGLSGADEVPRYGWLPVTVPGAPAGWSALSRRLGRLPFGELFEEVIELAERGFPIAPTVGASWSRAFEIYSTQCRGAEFEPWFELFAPEGRPPRVGEKWKPSYFADTFRAIAGSGGEDFYRGELAEKLLRFSGETGGLLSREDLSSYRPEWVEPVSVSYKGYEIWEPPPNGQGLTALMALGMLAKDDLGKLLPAEAVHLQVEAMKLAFADTRAHIADPDYMKVPSGAMLDPAYLKMRRETIGSKAEVRAPGTPEHGGTVYFAVADAEGTMVSFIQSNYMGFGSGLVVPETGISLHNRGCNFSLLPDHPNRIGPRKRPYHTIMPGFITRNGEALGPFGVMGGFMQPQGHLQVACHMIDYNSNPQEALDAPRWQWSGANRLLLEEGFAEDVATELARRGHETLVDTASSSFGRGQVILRDDEGVLWGATEKRCDGAIGVC